MTFLDLSSILCVFFTQKIFIGNQLITMIGVCFFEKTGDLKRKNQSEN